MSGQMYDRELDAELGLAIAGVHRIGGRVFASLAAA